MCGTSYLNVKLGANLVNQKMTQVVDSWYDDRRVGENLTIRYASMLNSIRHDHAVASFPRTLTLMGALARTGDYHFTSNADINNRTGNCMSDSSLDDHVPSSRHVYRSVCVLPWIRRFSRYK